MKIQSVFSQKTAWISDIRYPDIQTYFSKTDKAYKAVKKVVLPPSSNPKEVKLHFAMLFIFVFYSINRYVQKMGKNGNWKGVIEKMKNEIWISGYQISDIHPVFGGAK